MANGFLDNFARDLHLPKPPFWMVAGAITLVTLTWVPLALVARARVSTSSSPRVHIFQDMDEQPKYGAQDFTAIFQDHRAMRPPVAGTVARGELVTNPGYVQGYTLATGGNGQPTPTYLPTIPAEVQVDEQLLLRGQTMYNVYCFTCHGLTGKGNGPTHERAARLAGSGAAGTTWVQPANLHAPVIEENQAPKYGREQYPDGKLFNVITNGFNNMAAYGDQISVHDRWAIVAYVRALQTSQHQPPAPQQAAAK